MKRHITLGEFIIENQKDFPYAKGELSALLSSIRLAGKMVNQEINKAGLANIIGAAGIENVQGEAQQKLDVLANDMDKLSLKTEVEYTGRNFAGPILILDYDTIEKFIKANGKRVILRGPDQKAVHRALQLRKDGYAMALRYT